MMWRPREAVDRYIATGAENCVSVLVAAFWRLLSSVNLGLASGSPKAHATRLMNYLTTT